MGAQDETNRAIFVERAWPPLRVWVYFLAPVIVLALPYLFTDYAYLSWAGGFLLLWLVFGGGVLFVIATRYWWITPLEIRTSRLPRWVLAPQNIVAPKPKGERHIPLANVAKVEATEGKSGVLQRDAFGSRKAAGEQAFGSVHKSWCKGALIVRLSHPDEYGDTVLLSTDRPQEASSVLTRAIQDADRRRGTTT